MEQTAGGGGGGGGGGPAPFLIKTYEMVDDSSTDEIVSWSSTNASFVVWNPPDFAAKLLPTYFKHNNFSSFIRQLNTYGFRKIDPERWEFATEGFIKDHKHLLNNIHRRKPVHSHSHIHSHPDSERIALEEEIDRLSREKAALTADLCRFKQQQSGTKIQLEDLERRVLDMELRQAKMVAFLDRALHNPKFVDTLINMAAGSHFSSSILHKKRRLPGLDYCLEIADNSFYDNNNNYITTAAAASKPPDAGQVFNQDFCDKLKLGLCSGPPISETNINLLTACTLSSNEACGSPRAAAAAADHNRNGNNGRLECLSLVPDTLELSDTGTSLCPRKNSFFSGSVVDDGDALISSCHLNLTLASSSMQIDESGTSHNSIPPEEAIGNNQDDAIANREATKNQSDDAPTAANGNATSLPDATAQTGNQGPPAPPGRVNDVFWEQFLTERPGSSDTEEASSSLRADPSDDSQEERKAGNDSMWKNRKDMEQLTL